MKKVLIIAPSNTTFVNDTQLIYSGLYKKNISISVILCSIGCCDKNEVEDVKKLYQMYNIPAKAVYDYHNEDALRILQKENPSLVLGYNDHEAPGNSFVVAAKHLKIPILIVREAVIKTNASPYARAEKIVLLLKVRLNVLPHFIHKYIYYFKTLFAINPFLLMNFPKVIVDLIKDVTSSNVGDKADYLLAPTSESAKYLRQQCPNARFIEVVGNPRFDTILSYSPSEVVKARLEVQKLFQIPKNKKIFLFLSQNMETHGLITTEQKVRLNSDILETLALFRENIYIIIKLHPREINIFPLIWKKEYDDFITVTDFDLDQLIQASDIVLTWFSTAMINTVLAKKPMILLNLVKIDMPIAPLEITYMADEGVALNVSDINDLRQALKELIENEELEEKMISAAEGFRFKYLSSIDGNSSDKLMPLGIIAIFSLGTLNCIYCCVSVSVSAMTFEAFQSSLYPKVTLYSHFLNFFSVCGIEPWACNTNGIPYFFA